jgi:von Willebrand factor type A domain-containing protein/type IX secretion system substrate protein
MTSHCHAQLFEIFGDTMKRISIVLLSLLILQGFNSLHAQQNEETRIVGVDQSAFPFITFWAQFPGKNETKRAIAPSNTLVTEDGSPVDVTISCPIEQISFAVMLDYSTSMAFKIGAVVIPGQPWPFDPDSIRWRSAKSAIRSFASKIEVPDSAAFIKFARRVTVAVPFTDDGDEIIREVEDIRLSSGTSWIEACLRGIDLLSTRKGIRVAILLTDGDDTTSPGWLDSSDVINEALANNVAVYTIGLGAFEDSSKLSAVAQMTGGEFYISADGSDLEEVYSNIINSITLPPCEFTYTSDQFCPDSSMRKIDIFSIINENVYTADTLYKAPFDLEKTSVISHAPTVVFPGDVFRVEMEFETELREDEPTSFTSTLEYDDEAFEFLGIETDDGIFIDNDPIAFASNGVVTINANTTVFTPSNNYLFTLVFRARVLTSARSVTFNWLNVNVVRKCNTITTGEVFTILADGLCNKVIRLREPPMLQSMYPNPATHTTVVSFSISHEHAIGKDISLSVRNEDGTIVTELAKGYYPAGDYSIPWQTSQLPNGVYWVELQSGEDVEVKKLVIVR